MHFEVGEKTFEVLDRHPTRRPAAGNARKIGRVQPELIHPRLHPGRHVIGPRHVGRYRQTANRRFNPMSLAVQGAGPVVREAIGFRLDRRGHIKSQLRRIFLARLEVTQHRADRITLVQIHQPVFDPSATRRGNVHRGLVGLDLDDVLVRVHFVADLDQ